MSPIYVKKLYHHSKSLCVALCLFVLLTLLANIVSNECTPLFVWSMYSRPAAEAEEFSFYELQYNKDQVYYAPHTWKDHKRMMFFYTAEYLDIMLQNNNCDPNSKKATYILKLPTQHLYVNSADVANYAHWLQTYMEDNISQHIDSLKVYKKTLRYSPSGAPILVKSQLLCSTQ